MRRWRIPRDFEVVAIKADAKQRSDLAKKFGEAIGQIGKRLRKFENTEQKETVEELFLINFVEVLIYLAEIFIENCPKKEQKQLMLIRLQAEVDSLAGGEGLVKVSIDDIDEA